MSRAKPLKIEKKDLPGLLDELRREWRVVAPVRGGGIVLFEEIAAGRDALLEFTNTRMSPKHLFFPRSDVLFSYRSDGTGMKLAEPAGDAGKTVIFGMRPCDARAVLMLDKVFLQEGREDPGYKRRRDNTIILALGCTSPRSTCFCTSMGGNPFSGDGADAVFTDIGDAYIVEAVTPRGEELLEREVFVAADDDSLKAAEEVREKARTAITSRVEAKAASGMDVLEAFNSTVWDTVHEKCLGCGVCTYLCPTCSCFDVVDEKNGEGGDRIRIWDPCQFPLYTLQASGFNPRPTGKERMRQRVLHKVKYTVESDGEVSCVGCGRCVVNCPVNLDIRQAINNLVGGTN